MEMSYPEQRVKELKVEKENKKVLEWSEIMQKHSN